MKMSWFCSLLVKWKWSNSKFRLFLYVCLCRPLMMLSFTAQKDGPWCWFSVGPRMESGSSAFPS